MLPFSQSMKSSVGDVGLVGAVGGGVSGIEALGMMEPWRHKVVLKAGAAKIVLFINDGASLSDKVIEYHQRLNVFIFSIESALGVALAV